jgi:hypothetical protein
MQKVTPLTMRRVTVMNFGFCVMKPMGFFFSLLL